MVNPHVLSRYHDYLSALHKVLYNAGQDGLSPAALVETLAVEFLVSPPAPTITDVEANSDASPVPEDHPNYHALRPRAAPQRRKKT